MVMQGKRSKTFNKYWVSTFTVQHGERRNKLDRHMKIFGNPQATAKGKRKEKNKIKSFRKES
jgi:hypothetical protein